MPFGRTTPGWPIGRPGLATLGEYLVFFVRCDLEIATDYIVLPALLRFMCLLLSVVVWDGQKLEFLSHAQSDWAETFWRPWVGIPD
jgi:hypothetical protein